MCSHCATLHATTCNYHDTIFEPWFWMLNVECRVLEHLKQRKHFEWFYKIDDCWLSGKVDTDEKSMALSECHSWANKIENIECDLSESGIRRLNRPYHIQPYSKPCKANSYGILNNVGKHLLVVVVGWKPWL